MASTGRTVGQAALKLLAELGLSDLSERVRSESSLAGLIDLALGRVIDDPAYERAAERLFLLKIYREVWDRPAFDYRRYFPDYIRQGVKLGALDPRLLDFDLERLCRRLRPERDLLLPYIGLYTLYDRYLVRDPETGQVLEAPRPSGCGWPWDWPLTRPTAAGRSGPLSSTT